MSSNPILDEAREQLFIAIAENDWIEVIGLASFFLKVEENPDWLMKDEPINLEDWKRKH